MPSRIFFQSSLPRSGSTLLQNIMGQNPDFYVTPTSGVLELVYSARGQFTHSPEFSAQDRGEMAKAFAAFCRGGVESYFDALTDKPYVLDKSRGWGIHHGFLSSFYPEPKIVCMVRDLRAIFASMEKNHRDNQHLDNGMVNHAEMTGTSTEKRVQMWANSQPVGLAIERLQDIFVQGIDKHMLFVRYEDLCSQPYAQMARIYKYFGLPEFDHDFDAVAQLTVEDDAVYGIYGDHKIRPEVTPPKADFREVLGPQLCSSIEQSYSWFFKLFSYSS